MDGFLIGAAVLAAGYEADQYMRRRDDMEENIKRAGLNFRSESIQNLGELGPGDHISRPIKGLEIADHHAIAIRVINSTTVEVIHFSEPTSSSGSSSSAGKGIRKDKMDVREFLNEGTLMRVFYEREYKLYVRGEAVDRAESALREHEEKAGRWYNNYNVMNNNCEHFATWCKTGHGFSMQTGV